eukprot:4512402-Amphidinium_carterae.1
MAKKMWKSLKEERHCMSYTWRTTVEWNKRWRWTQGRMALPDAVARPTMTLPPVGGGRLGAQ